MNYEDLARELGIPSATIAESVENARRSIVPDTKRISVVEKGKETTFRVTREGVGPLKIRVGGFLHVTQRHGPLQSEFVTFQHLNFHIDQPDPWGKYAALVLAPLSKEFIPLFRDRERLLLRTDSGCETGELFGDRTCECRDQLELALKEIAVAGEGMLINIPRQDGRGLGLPFKLATLRLQDELGVTTTQAPALLDPDTERDVRTYSGIVAVLKYLGVPTTTQLLLASNNPKKFAVFVENGWAKPIQEPVVIPPSELTRRHLLAKQTDLDHINLVPRAD